VVVNVVQPQVSVAKEVALAAETNVEQAVAAVQKISNAEKAMTNRVVADALLRAKARNSALAAETNVEQAVAAVQKSSNAEKAMTNRVVADALLRAKARNSTEESTLNPGVVVNVVQPQVSVAKEVALAAETNVEQAVAAVQKSSNAEKAMRNRVVADALLRAKARNSTEESTLNPGSVGHPELCWRPCLFFAQGKCENGLACVYCHASHPRRAAHLDKRNREVLQSIDFLDRCMWIGPILKQKFECIRGAEYLAGELDDVWHRMHIPSTAVKSDRSKPSQDLRHFIMALKLMSARSIFFLLHKDSAAYPMIEKFLHRCAVHGRPDSSIGDVDSQL